MKMKNLDQVYKTLGLNSKASLSEIKKAYRTLVKIHHPDKGGFSIKFDEIQQAYEILTDPAKLQAIKEGKDASSVDSKSEAAKKIVINLFSRTISNRFVADYEDLTKKMDAECNEIRRRTMDSLEDSENHMQQLEVIQSRIVKGDVLKSEIIKVIEHHKEKVARLNRDMEEINLASEMIAEFEYNFDKDDDITGVLDYEYQGLTGY